MTAARVVLLRHGQTEYNVLGRLQGQVDIPLDEIGTAQAAAVAPVLATLRPARIVASDLGRAMGTAQAVADHVGLQVVADARLRERSFGKLEGMYDHEIRAAFPDTWAARRAGGALEGVDAELRGAVGRRFAESVDEHAGLVGEGETLLVVAHGACIAAGITELIGLDAEEFVGIRGLGNCHWSVLGKHRRGDWRLEAHNVGAVPVAVR